MSIPAVCARDPRSAERRIEQSRASPGLDAAPDARLAIAFARTVGVYLASVLPGAREQMRAWDHRTRAIPDTQLRAVALRGLAKRGNIEGAAVLSVLAPREHRPAAVRALVAFQSAYNYLDALSERPNAQPAANAEQLHEALLVALHPDAQHPDYYAHDSSRGRDGGFLRGLVDVCREALSELPAFAIVAAHAREAAARIVDFQALNRDRAHGGHDALARWAEETTPLGSGLAWWETAAAAGSSLAVHALIAAAAHPHTTPARVRAIHDAYFPWVGALHSLLDSLVDREEDARDDQPSLLDPYRLPPRVLAGLSELAGHAREAAAGLPDAVVHRVILTAMCSYYLSAPQAGSAEGRAVAASLTDLLGPSLALATGMFRTRRLAYRLTGREYS